MFDSHPRRPLLAAFAVFLLAACAAATLIWRLERQDPLVLALEAALGLLFSLLFACAAKLLLELRAHKQGLEGQVAVRTAEVRASEARYRELFEANPQPMWVYDLETLKFLAVNDAAVAHYGYSRGEFGTMSILDIRPAEEVPRLLQHVAQVKEENIRAAGIWRHRRKDGTQIDVEITSHVLEFGGRRAQVVLANDITERKAAEAKVQRLSRLYAALSQCNQAIVRSASAEELMREICRVAVEFGGMKMAWIGLLDADGRRVRPQASYGTGTEFLQGVDFSIEAGSAFSLTTSGTAIRENRPVWCQDYVHDPATAPWHELAVRAGWGATASLPLHRNAVAVGSFTLLSGELGPFDEAVRDLLIEMATDIGFALDNFERESRRRQAEQAVRESEARYRALN